MARAANAEAQGYGILSEGPHHDPDTMFEDVLQGDAVASARAAGRTKALRASKNGAG